MTSRDFVYWLQGFFEIQKATIITEEKTEIIRNHLNLVFKHDIDKQYKPGDGTQEIHDGKKSQPLFPSSDTTTLLRC